MRMIIVQQIRKSHDQLSPSQWGTNHFAPVQNTDAGCRNPLIHTAKDDMLSSGWLLTTF